MIKNIKKMTPKRYWHPLKYTAKMREQFYIRNENGKESKKQQPSLILRTNNRSGHFGMGGRFGQLKEKAFEYAFLYKALGLKFQ